MVTMGTRIAIAPEDPAVELQSSILEDKDQTSLFKALSDDGKDKAKLEREEAEDAKAQVTAQYTSQSAIAIQNNDNAEVDKSNNVQSESFEMEAVEKVEECSVREKNNGDAEDNMSYNKSQPVEIEGATNALLTEDKVLHSKIDDLCNLRDCAVLSVIQRVSRYVSDGKKNAKGAVDAWRTASTKALQEKAKIRCARKCKELWAQLEKQKTQVRSIRNENTHYMNNLTKEDQGKDRMLSKNSIIEEEEHEIKGVGDCGGLVTPEQRTDSRIDEFFSDIATQPTPEEEKENEQQSKLIMVTDSKESVGNHGKQKELTGLANGNEIDDEKKIDSSEELIEVKCPYGSPLTIETVCESSDGEDTIGSTDVLTEIEVNALSMSDDICAVQRSTIDFALAIIDCDVVLVDIGVMQNLILVAETAIKGKVFKAPIPKPTTPLMRVASARTLTSKIAKRAGRKMNAIQRAILKVDKHRQRKRFMVASR